jgi:hypothetical protein
MNLGWYTEYNIDELIEELIKYNNKGNLTILEGDLLNILKKIKYSRIR